MEKSEAADAATSSEAQAAGDGGNQEMDAGQPPVAWHEGGEAVIAYGIRQGAKAGQLLVQREDPLVKIPGQASLSSDVTITRRGYTVDGPIGEVLGEYSTIEYKSPGESCTAESMGRSWGYTMLYAAPRFDPDGTAGVPRLATVMVCAMKPVKLFKWLRGTPWLELVASATYKGVYDLMAGDHRCVRFVVTRELEYDKNGYIWFRWLRPALSEAEGRALIERLNGTRGEERSLGILVTRIALQANPEVAMHLLEDTSMMSEAFMEALDPYLQDRLAVLLKERLDPVLDRNEKLEGRVQVLEDEKQVLEDEKQVLEEQLDPVLDKNEKLEGRVQVLEDENEKLRDRLRLLEEGREEQMRCLIHQIRDLEETVRNRDRRG